MFKVLSITHKVDFTRALQARMEYCTAIVSSDHLSLRYRVDARTKTIAFTRSEAVTFLESNGIIDRADKGEMYLKTLTTHAGRRGEPIQREFFVHLPWNKLHLTQSEISLLIARHEWDENGRMIQFSRSIKVA